MTRFLKLIRPTFAALAVSAPFQSGCAWAEARPRPVAIQQSEPHGGELGELGLDVIRERLLSLHNEARVEAKLRTLEVSPRLREAAQKHAEEMAKRGEMTHEGENGSTPAERIKAEGYRFRRCGENVAHGRFTLEELMDGWLNSPPHKKNIFGSYTQIGIGRAKAKNGTPYWCVNFGLPTPSR